MAKDGESLNLTNRKAQDVKSIALINEVANKRKMKFHDAARLIIEAGAKALSDK